MCHPALASMHRMLARTTLLLLMWGMAGGAAAQAAGTSPDAARLEQKLDQSLRLIQALTERVEQLEKQLAVARRAPPPPTVPAAPAPATPEATAARLDEVEKTVSQLTSASSRDLRDSGLAVHGFADVGLAMTRRAPSGQRGGFALGSIDFYLTPELGPNIKTLVELNFGVSESGSTEADLERIQLGYAFSDQLTLWLGRFHTPFGYWNMAFHHGAQIQPSILRPRLLDFEDDGGILPVHTIGLWGTGHLRTGAGKLVYNLYVGNGARIAHGSLDPNPAGDDSGNKALGFSVGHRFNGALEGLAVGVHGLRQTVNSYDASDVLTSRTRLGMFGGYGVYDDNGWEVIAEYYRMKNSDLSGGSGSHSSWTGYAHVGHVFQERWMPYYRFEKASLNQSDNYFLAQANGRSYSRHVLGLRFNANPRAALKFELNRTRDDALARALDELRMQYAVSF